jgi:pyrimidine-nucleoside phosphorylase
LSEVYLPSEIIKRKREGLELTVEEIQFFINSYASGALPDYQMAAWMMAVFFRGMSSRERLALTETMLRSGAVIDLSDVPGFKVDKHSTGGVGDKTSLILGPLVAACGAFVPMMSGRGLGHTGGTLDKLESIPGFKTQLSIPEFRKITAELGVCFIGQTPEICPADKKMYALRDVTATVESLPLICGSIMSKKLAEGIDGLVLDVKVGSGAFMKTLHSAEELARVLIETGTSAGKKVSAFITQMDQPLGTHIGNALEVEEVLAVLRNEPAGTKEFAETRKLSILLAAEMLRLAGVCHDLTAGEALCEKALTSGRAMEIFEKVVDRQGGRLNQIPKAKFEHRVVAKDSGFVSRYNTEGIGLASVVLGAGRLKFSDTIDPTAGIISHKVVGDDVRAGDLLFTLRASDTSKFAAAEEMLRRATTISLQKAPTPSLILKHMVG